MIEPFYVDDSVTLYLGDMREVLPRIDLRPDCVVADPPYGETAHGWDRWPDGWPTIVAEYARSMWCFGSIRMFLDRRDEFDAWKLSQDVVWKKHKSSSFVTDRFARTHEIVTYWYQGKWTDIQHEALRVPRQGKSQGTRRKSDAGPHLGVISHDRPWCDDGTRLMQSVIEAKSMRGRAIHPTEKPIEILDPLIRYGCPLGGTVLDPFAGSGSTAEAARLSGRRAVLIEAHEPYCEAIARRMRADVLPLHITGEAQ